MHVTERFMAPLVFAWMVFTTQAIYAQTSSVTTSYNDISRAGVYSESQLTPTTVTPATFGKLHTWEVRGGIYTQPLYVSGVQIPNKGKTNVVYIATTFNIVYAFDADNLTLNAAPLWQTPLGNPAPPPADSTRNGGVSPFWCSIHSPVLGVLSTPVIDLQKQEMYVVATEINNPGGPPHPVPPHILKIYVLDIVTGKKLRSAEISAAVDGDSKADQQDPSYNRLWPVDGKIHFNPYRQLNRPGLLLHKGVLYMAFGSLCDIPVYHGWVMSYNPSTLQQLGAFATTPYTSSSCANNGNDCGSLGGIWQSGRGIAADEDSVYVANGNGTLAQSTRGRSFSDSVIRLSLTTLQVQEFFTPWNQSYTSSSANDLDNGTSGVILSHDTAGHTVVFTGGKGGKIYTLWKGQFPGFGDAIHSRDIGALTCDGMTLPNPAPDKSRDLYPAQGFFAANPTFIPGLHPSINKTTVDLCCPVLYTPHVHQILVWPPKDQRPLRLYVWPEVSTLKMFELQENGRFPFLWRNNSDTRQQGYYGLASAQSEQGLTPGRHPGGALSLSTDGTQGIIWATHACDWNATALHNKCGQLGNPGVSIWNVQKGILRAFDATGDGMYLKELWNSNNTLDPNDKIRHLGKFTPPTIANGKVFVVDLPDLPNVASELGQLHVYGLKERCSIVRQENIRLDKELTEAGARLNAGSGMQRHMSEHVLETLRAQQVTNDQKARFYNCTP